MLPSAWRGSLSTLKARLQKAVPPFLKQRARNLLIDGLGTLDAATIAARRFELALHCSVECHAVAQFIDLADAMGLQVPEAPEHWWPPADHPHANVWRSGPAFGLAQHHGIPTRLLDWSLNPLKAAYFAAHDALDREPSDLAVWALYAPLERRRAESNDTSHPKHHIVFVRHSRAHNRYLHAQDGVFTLVRAANHHFLQTGEWPRTENIVSQRFRKLMLPSSEARELLRLLWAEGISGPHLRPTYDQCASTLRQLWHDGGSPAL